MKPQGAEVRKRPNHDPNPTAPQTAALVWRNCPCVEELVDGAMKENLDIGEYAKSVPALKTFEGKEDGPTKSFFVNLSRIVFFLSKELLYVRAAQIVHSWLLQKPDNSGADAYVSSFCNAIYFLG